jgi:hypothetical protein
MPPSALLTISLHLPPEAATDLTSHAAVESFEFFAGRPPEASGSSLTLSLPPLFVIFLRHFLGLLAFFQVFISFFFLTSRNAFQLLFSIRMVLTCSAL